MLRRALRTAALSLIALTVLAGRPAPATAQMNVFARCLAGPTCSTVRFSFTNTGSFPLVFFQFVFGFPSPATMLFVGSVGGSVPASDSFGPLTGTVSGISSNQRSVTVDFGAFELVNVSNPFGIGSTGYVDLGAQGNPPAAFTVDATADDNAGGTMVLSGAGTIPPAGVVPEPVSMVLLGTGLAALGAARRRRRKIITD